MPMPTMAVPANCLNWSNNLNRIDSVVKKWEPRFPFFYFSYKHLIKPHLLTHFFGKADNPR